MHMWIVFCHQLSTWLVDGTTCWFFLYHVGFFIGQSDGFMLAVFNNDGSGKHDQMQIHVFWPRPCQINFSGFRCPSWTEINAKLGIRWTKAAPSRPKLTPSWRQVNSISRLIHVALGWPKLAPRWLHESPKRRHDGPTCAQVTVRWSKLGLKTAKIGSMWRLVRPSWPQDGRSWAQDGPK